MVWPGGSSNTLRERVMHALREQEQTGDHVIIQLSMLAEIAPVVEISDLLTYLWDETPAKGNELTTRTFPNPSLNTYRVKHLGSENNDALFFEGEAPQRGLRGGILANSSGDAGPYSIEDFEEACRLAEVEQRTIVGEPTISTAEDALVGRLGILAVSDLAPGKENREVYQTMGIRRPEDLAQVISLATFVEHDRRFGHNLVLPQIIHYVPVGRDWKTLFELENVIPMQFSGFDYDSSKPNLRTDAEFLVRESHYSALFGLSVFNSLFEANNEFKTNPYASLRRNSSDGIGPVWTLQLDGLRGHLNQIGAAQRSGVASALTTCQAAFRND